MLKSCVRDLGAHELQLECHPPLALECHPLECHPPAKGVLLLLALLHSYIGYIGTAIWLWLGSIESQRGRNKMGGPPKLDLRKGAQ